MMETMNFDTSGYVRMYILTTTLEYGVLELSRTFTCVFFFFSWEHSVCDRPAILLTSVMSVKLTAEYRSEAIT